MSRWPEMWTLIWAKTGGKITLWWWWVQQVEIVVGAGIEGMLYIRGAGDRDS